MPRTIQPESGVTIIEVLVAAVVIFLGLGAIFTLNTRSLQILRHTRQYATASQVLLERLEMMRRTPWPQVTRGQPLTALLQAPAISGADLADADPLEDILISIPTMPGQPTQASPIMEVRRIHGQSQLVQDGDLSAAPIIVIDASINWRDGDQSDQRNIRTVIARNGLTRAGVFGSVVGRPQNP